MASPKRVGTLYFVLSESQQLVKIGFADDPKSRIAALQSGNPSTLTLMFEAPCTLEAEKALHQVIKPHRVIREWYPNNCLADAVFDTLGERLIDKAMLEAPETIGSVAFEAVHARQFISARDIAELRPELEALVEFDQDDEDDYAELAPSGREM